MDEPTYLPYLLLKKSVYLNGWNLLIGTSALKDLLNAGVLQ